MISWIVDFSVRNKMLIIMSTITIAAFGIYSFFNIPLGTVPDITNNQVQIITVSPNLSTQDVEEFITYPIELEMGNLPGIQEIRSISKFGISLVTLVFEDKIGTYLPRQLIAEKLQTVTEKIPMGIGKPEMGPITTGLGEIYQYVLEVKPEYKDRYDAMQLRTIQDWQIRRQLAGIKGVVEINSWGGYLKQFEISVYPEKLYEYNVTLKDVYDALILNNSVAGGSYIEKNNKSYFIRGDGLIKSIDDIERIVVKTNNLIPILIRDVAEVTTGYAPRFGAITANGKGETVLGQIMMLKGSNSSQVIQDVKKRIEEIQSKLPEGIIISPINDRSELITKTTTTVLENLIFGSIIVFFTVLIFLGNFRSAIIISSLIPLSLLFTISVMYLTGIDVNLLSLGALDFGVIIDGGVIIVEYLLVQFGINEFLFSNKNKNVVKSDIQKNIDNITYKSTFKMTNSAIFGQVIVLIVFIPIYVLSGVEGKMFRPMALSFSFALVGAIIFGFTWIPVISSIFLRPAKASILSGFSEKFIKLIYQSYYPVLVWAYNKKLFVLSLATSILILSFFIFNNLGGEFVPTLDEGDFVIQPIIKSGTSLSKTIDLTTQMESILLKNYPNEIEKIASRIGAAEVPTDPMGMEEVDMIIKLKPKSEWKVTDNKEELANKFKESLSVIPGVDFEFTQPIEMRFNELITGVRSDIAIKIFGDDINRLDEIAQKIKNNIQDIPGAADISVEKTVGLPQVLVKYNREKIAHYGISIFELNEMLGMAFGGGVTGLFIEGDKRFDIVVRLNKNNRNDIEDIRNMPVISSEGRVIPLSELAIVEYYHGPAKVSHENSKRRIVVNVNVRNRDLQSVVSDIIKVVNDKLVLPQGYYIKYGGQFENLQNAINRLIIAVPIALLLIFIFIHFALGSFKKALMVYVAVPMATIGGILMLWIRGMPFSISAGIGFIALFGIAVMNGIVLIEHLDELEKQGFVDIKTRIFKAVKDRFRPVLMTASSAALGFLPMAISTSAGAEVQRPLASVVIGGLITSTMLTLIALPLLYAFFMQFDFKRISLIFSRKKMLPLLFFVFFLVPLKAQDIVDLDNSLNLAIKNSKLLKYNEKNYQSQKALANYAIEFEKTEFFFSYDQNNISQNGYPVSNFGFRQNFKFPSYYPLKKAQYNKNAEITNFENVFYKQNLHYQVSYFYSSIVVLKQKIELLEYIDSIYNDLILKFDLAFQKGYCSNVDNLSVKLKSNEIKQQLIQDKNNYLMVLNKWRWLIGNSNAVPDTLLPALINNIDDTDTVLNTYNYYYDALNDYYKYEYKSIKANNLPDIFIQYFNGSNKYVPKYNYLGFEIGIALPIFPSYLANQKAAALKLEGIEFYKTYKQQEIKNNFSELKLYYTSLLEIYKIAANEKNVDLVELNRMFLYNLNSGNINYYQWLQLFETVVNKRINYYDILLKLYEIQFRIKYGIYEN